MVNYQPKFHCTTLYWSPSHKADTVSDFDYFYSNDGLRYKLYLLDTSLVYLMRVNYYIKHGDCLANMLEKPNANRLLEFCINTVTLFGHALIVSELFL